MCQRKITSPSPRSNSPCVFLGNYGKETDDNIKCEVKRNTYVMNLNGKQNNIKPRPRVKRFSGGDSLN